MKTLTMVVIVVVLPLIAGCTQAQIAAFNADFSARQRQELTGLADDISHTLSGEVYRNWRRSR